MKNIQNTLLKVDQTDTRQQVTSVNTSFDHQLQLTGSYYFEARVEID